MTKEKKPEITDEKMGLNPFLPKLSIPVNKVTFKKQYARDKDGEWMPVEKELETESSCKVYLDKERRVSMTKLSARGKDLLLWIIYESENSSEWLWINKRRYMKEGNVTSINTYKSALVELIKAGYLLSSVIKDVYWINPRYFFNGNRVNKFPKNIVRK
jgi:hypothetical protein